MHAPENNYLTAKFKGAPASAKMEAEFCLELGKPGTLWGKTVFLFFVIKRLEIALEGALSEGEKEIWRSDDSMCVQVLHLGFLILAVNPFCLHPPRLRSVCFG